MTDGIPPFIQLKSEDDEQGQKMTIYMPTGAVIVERSDLESPTAVSSTHIQSEEPQVSSKVGSESVQSHGAVINIYTSDDARGLKELSQAKVPPIENAPINEQQTLLRISEMLDLITKRLDHKEQPTDAVVKLTNPDEKIEKKRTIIRDSHQIGEKYISIGYFFDWIHAINVIYIFLILFSILLPSGLQTFLKMEIFAASTSSGVGGTQRGDLIISEHSPASALVVGDVVSLHNAFSGTTGLTQVSEVSAPGVNGEITIVSPPQVGQTANVSNTVAGNLVVNRVTTLVPNLGFAKMLLDSFYFQALVGFSVILLNIIVQWRRYRRYFHAYRN